MSKIKDLIAQKQASNPRLYLEGDVGVETVLQDIMGQPFAFCGCGDPKSAYKFLHDLLTILALDDWKIKFDQLDNLFNKNTGIQYFVYYMIDNMELTEHGGSVPGWLTDKGKDLLDLLNEIDFSREGYMHNNNLCLIEDGQ